MCIKGVYYGTSTRTLNDDLPSRVVKFAYWLPYCKHAITLPARTEVTVWLPVPLAHRETTRELLIDRLAARHGVNSDIAVACSLSVPEDGLVPVRFINIEHRSVTIPAASPVARCLVDYEVKPAGALDLSSDDPYERLSERAAGHH